MGLSCTVYMGEEDTRRQALNVARMRLLGAEVIPVTTGSRTLKDAINEAFRDWVTNVETTHYVFGTVAGPHPFPAMVRDFQRVIGDEAREQVLERDGRLPDAVARLRRRRLQRDRHLHRLRPRRRRRGWSASRPAATASRPAGTPRRSPAARRACCTARGRYLLQDEDGQTVESHSISAGLDYPGVGPEHACLHDIGRAEYRPVTDAEAMEAFALLCRTEGIIPAIESAHALAGAMVLGRELGPDVAAAGQPLRPRRQGRRHRVALVRARSTARTPTPARAWTPTSSPPRARSATTRPWPAPDAGRRRESSWPSASRGEGRGPRGADRLPAGRLPDVDASIAAMVAMVEAGADVVEVGMPYSDPVMDGPVIQEAVDVAVRAGARHARRAAGRRGGRRRRRRRRSS